MKKLITILLAAVMLFSAAAPAFADSASTIRLQKTEGTVTVTNASAKALTVRSDMRLFSGYHVKTAAKSYAWLSLDDTKAAKVDASSDVEVRTRGRKLEVLAASGNVFFSVSENLQSDETLNIRTSTMVTGIRGTSGWVEAVDGAHSRVYILEGAVESVVTDPVSGQSKTATIMGGQYADFYVYDPATPGDKCAIVMGEFSRGDVSGFVLAEIFGDAALAEKIWAGSGIDLRDLTQEEIDAALAAAEQAQEQLSAAAEQAAEGLKSDKTPVWSADGGGEGEGGGSGGAVPVTPVTPAAAVTALTTDNTVAEVAAALAAGDAEMTKGTPEKFSVDSDLTVPAGKTFTVQNDVAGVVVETGATLTVDGTMEIKGTLENHGTVVVTSADTLIVGGAFLNDGVVMNAATGHIVADIVSVGALTTAGRIDGTVTVDAGSLAVTGGVVTSGGSGATVTVNDGAHVSLTGGKITNTNESSATAAALAWNDTVNAVSTGGTGLESMAQSPVQDGSGAPVEIPGYGVNVGADGTYSVGRTAEEPPASPTDDPDAPTEYAIRVIDEEYADGSVKVSLYNDAENKEITSAKAGDVVCLAFTPIDADLFAGVNLDVFTSEGSINPSFSGRQYTFTMPSCDVTIRFWFMRKYHDIKVGDPATAADGALYGEPVHGRLVLANEVAACWDDAVCIASPDKGYKLESVTGYRIGDNALDESVLDMDYDAQNKPYTTEITLQFSIREDGRVSFTMPACDLLLCPKFVEDQSSVDPTSKQKVIGQFHGSGIQVSVNGAGISSGEYVEFEPGQAVTVTALDSQNYGIIGALVTTAAGASIEVTTSDLGNDACSKIFVFTMPEADVTVRILTFRTETYIDTANGYLAWAAPSGYTPMRLGERTTWRMDRTSAGLQLDGYVLDAARCGMALMTASDHSSVPDLSAEELAAADINCDGEAVSFMIPSDLFSGKVPPAFSSADSADFTVFLKCPIIKRDVRIGACFTRYPDRSQYNGDDMSTDSIDFFAPPSAPDDASVMTLDDAADGGFVCDDKSCGTITLRVLRDGAEIDTVKDGKLYAQLGDSLTVNVEMNEDYRCDKVFIEYTDVQGAGGISLCEKDNDGSYSFSMPACTELTVCVYVPYRIRTMLADEIDSGSSYTHAADEKHGTVTPDRNYAAKGEEFTVFLAADEGYAPTKARMTFGDGGWTEVVPEKVSDGVYLCRFTMPGYDNTTIWVLFEPDGGGGNTVAPFIVTDAIEGTDYTWTSDTLTVLTDANIAIADNPENMEPSRRIVVDSPNGANILLNTVAPFYLAHAPTLEISDNVAASATVTVYYAGYNMLQGGSLNNSSGATVSFFPVTDHPALPELVIEGGLSSPNGAVSIGRDSDYGMTAVTILGEVAAKEISLGKNVCLAATDLSDLRGMLTEANPEKTLLLQIDSSRFINDDVVITNAGRFLIPFEVNVVTGVKITLPKYDEVLDNTTEIYVAGGITYDVKEDKMNFTSFHGSPSDFINTVYFGQETYGDRMYTYLLNNGRQF